MALLNSELERVRVELGYSVIGIGALPFIEYVSLFEQVIQPYLNAGAKTTSSTAVTVLSPTPSAITLASPTGFNVGATLYVDVDGQGERVTLQSLSGSLASCLFTKTHTGIYSVTEEGGEAVVRDILAKLYQVKERLASDGMDAAGVKQLDKGDVILDTEEGQTAFDSLVRQRMYWRDELASALSIENLWRVRGQRGGSGCVELY